MDYVKELRALIGSRPLILAGSVVLIVNEKMNYFYNIEKMEGGACLVA